jgi:hypothetical protein
MDFRVCSLLQERVLGEPLASNGRLLWLHYSGLQASCHNMKADFRGFGSDDVNYIEHVQNTVQY